MWEGIHVTVPRIKLGKAIEVVIFIAALGVLAENIVLLRENRRLRETAAWQIPAGKHAVRDSSDRNA